MPLIARKIFSATLRQQIANEIRQAILTRALLPGERLIERDLSEHLGTSLTATREALIQLEMEGLITKKPNAATYVTKLSRTDIEQIHQVRRVLEVHAFEEAARLASPEEIEEIETIHRNALQVARGGSGIAYLERDLTWHQAVWRASQNAYLFETLNRLAVPLFGFNSIAVAMKPGFDLEKDALAHTALLQAIRDNDPEAARRAFEPAAAIWLAQALEVSEPVLG